MIPLLLAYAALACAAQDGASYDPHAKEYRAPVLSLAGTPDTPEITAALMPLWQGNVDKALPELRRLAEGGDVGSALLLGLIYRQQSKLPVPKDPLEALRFYRIASSRGSGEASERIAEMAENNEIPAQPDGDAATWRALAVKQGWVEEKLAVICFDWIHGPEPLHCEKRPGLPPLAVSALRGGLEQCPNEAEMALLLQQGLTGSISENGGALRNQNGPWARAILIVDHSVPSEQDLREPYAASVIYIQTPADRWRMLPPTAPLLDRFLILTPDAAGAGSMSMMAQFPDGSSSGGACSGFSK